MMHAAPRRRRAVVFAVAGGGAAVAAMAAALVAWFAIIAGGLPSISCGSAVSQPLHGGQPIPSELVPIFNTAAVRYQLGAAGPAILAALTKVESDFGRRLGPSTAGAVGWTQFMPDTWDRYGTDANGDGVASPNDAEDAITSAARYLKASGAPGDWRRALFSYNHADWYVARVLRQAEDFGLTELDPAGGCAMDAFVDRPPTRRVGGARLVEIPGMPGQRIDARILDDLRLIVARYHVLVTA